MADRKRVLITGITGFIAGHTATAFLNAGYEVRGTMRSLNKAEITRDTLSKLADVSKLEFVEADLMSDDGWSEAMKGIANVAHMASPFPLGQPKDENELIRPAVDGTLRVLNAATRTGVSRFVQTSSVAAIAYGHNESRTAPYTEADWSNPDGPGIGAYAKSKTLAERAARDFVQKSAGSMHYSSVNPGLVLGPLLDRNFGTSVDMIRMFLAGKYPGTPKIDMSVVDVRDVAALHLKAMETKQPSGGRYIAVDRYVPMLTIALALRRGLGAKAAKVPRRDLPNFVTRLVALVDPGARSILPELGRTHSIDNSKTRKALNMPKFISAEDAAIATGQSLIDLGLV
jgi:dihydroflavonol-4-reductase